MNDLDLAWVAGVFDTKGHCHVTRYRGTKNGTVYFRPVVRIESLDRSLLVAVAETVGLGSVVSSPTKADFKATRERGTVTVIRSERYRYQLQNRTAILFLETVRPFVRAKRAAIDVVLNTRNNGAVNAGPLGRIRELHRALSAAQKTLVRPNAR